MKSTNIVLKGRRYRGLTTPPTTWEDISRYRNNGTLVGATWVRLPSGLWVLSFDGNDYISVADADNLDFTGNYTIILWATLSTVASNMGLFSKLVDANHCYAMHYQTSTKNWFTIIRKGGINYQKAFPTNTQSVINVPHCIACRMSGTTVSLFDNGVKYTLESYGGWAAPTNEDLRIGVYAGYYYRGLIQGYREINTDLSDEQIISVFSQERHLFGV